MDDTIPLVTVSGEVLRPAELSASDLEVEAVFHAVDVGAPHDVDRALLRPVTSGVLDRILDTVTSRGVAAVARIPSPSLAAALGDAVAAGGPVVIAVEVADPGNLGTIVRAAEASGCGAVLVTDRTVDLWSPKVVRSAAGAAFRLPLIDAGSPLEAVRACHDAGMSSVALTLTEADALDEVDLGGPVAIVVGNEAHGLSSEVIDACAHRARIEMAGPTESLNVAMATTVACFEALRQRRHRK
jgi:TrmH family RNA methyltransferase